MNTVLKRVAIVRDASDDVAMSGPVSWAIRELSDILAATGIDVQQQASGDGTSDLTIVAAGPSGALGRELAQGAGLGLPSTPEALVLAPGRLQARPAVLAAGADARGLVYALLELADRVANRDGADPVDLLTATQPLAEQPANAIRGVARLQVSDVEDLPWFHDRDGWQRYLTMLATHRYNRVHLAFGIGHDFLRNVLDAYLLFPYPFLVAPPGHEGVRAIHTSTGQPLPAAERERNLDTLRFISDEAAKRGLHFQLGIWTQQYQWTDSPNATYITEGLSTENHATYCRDALRAIVETCPGIAGVTLRVHGESGVPEGNYDFWRTVFTGLSGASRRVELDLHPKGVDRAMIELALETGLTINVSPKYTAEHMGLPGHQAAIRPTEAAPHRPDSDAFMQGLMNRSHFDLSYTRYGYADFLEEGRGWDLYFRIWPGTQRVLLWGNPAFAAGYGRYGSIGGSLGVEVMEPLSFKGRRGSGLPGGRHAYADASLAPGGTGGWEKYRYPLRLFGRLLYNPDADADSWQRQLRQEFGAAAAGPVETALAQASRILPLVTTAHHPSAANNRYWPEIYTNMPIVEAGRSHPYRDTVQPSRFGTVSAHDPMTFSSVEEYADGVVTGKRDGRYSPLRVAAWLTESAAAASAALSQGEQRILDSSAAGFRRLATDVRIQIGLGRFFADKLRAGVAYALFKRTGQRGYLEQAVSWYERARAAWVEVIEQGQVYRDDITVGGEAWLRGHWADRLPAIDDDLGDMRAELAGAGGTPGEAAPDILGLDAEVPAATYSHTPPAPFRRGEPVEVALTVQVQGGSRPAVALLYRHLNQARTYECAEMSANSDTFRATIPGAATDSPYPLVYLFEIRTGPDRAWRYPGLNDDLANQPYFVVRQQPA